MKKIIDWFKQSNRYKHFLIGIGIGAGADSIYCAAYAGVGAAFTAELKDKLWGGQPDWIDFLITVAGVAAGQTARLLLI